MTNQSNKEKAQQETELQQQQQQALMYEIQEYQLLSSSFPQNSGSAMISNTFYQGNISDANVQHFNDMLPIDYPTPAPMIPLQNSYNSSLYQNTKQSSSLDYSCIYQQQEVYSKTHLQQENFDTFTPRKEQDVFHELVNLARNKNTQQQVKDEAMQQFEKYLDTTTSSPEQYAVIPTPVVVRRQDTPVFPTIKSKSDLIYELKIIQQPERGRMFGYGSKDRRPISPAPILELIVKTKDGEQLNPETFDVSFLVVTCDLHAANEKSNTIPISQFHKFSTTDLDENTIDNTLQVRELVGSLATSAMKLYNLDNQLGIYFVFHDLSLRSEGTYKLKFILIDIESPDFHKINTTSVSKVIQSVESNTFVVYSIKKFPGVAETTPLSLCFARQGVKLPTRRLQKKLSIEAEDEEDSLLS